MRLAAIDVGTNTLRLLIADADATGAYRPIVSAQEITRLGQGLLPDRTLKPPAIRRSLEVLAQFSAMARSHGAARMRAVGTSALRDAGNREAFLAAARNVGVSIDVVSGEEEARLTVLGIRASLPALSGTWTMIDIGGGSTEILAADGDSIRGAVSTPLGSVGLTEAHLHGDPPGAQEVAALRTAVTRTLHGLPGGRDAGDARTGTLVGTAGTITTLAAIDLSLERYDPARVNGHRLGHGSIDSMLQRLATLPLAARRHVPGLEPARADIIVAGAAICLETMAWLGFRAITVSDGGLREGILVDLQRREPDKPLENLDKGGAIC
jgi:exopolyphosphatase/guanosine-5'-triphosphate,3'-diphosphate pyrophosphatase